MELNDRGPFYHLSQKLKGNNLEEGKGIALQSAFFYTYTVKALQFITENTQDIKCKYTNVSEMNHIQPKSNIHSRLTQFHLSLCAR